MLSTAHLPNSLRGRVIRPDDPGYDRARTVFSGTIDRRPAVIVRPADAEDVARVIGFARETGAELAVRSGGHSGAGHSVSEGGVVLDLGDMRAIEIDVEGRTAWAQTGMTAGQYTSAAGEHGLATGFGDAGSVGIGGITLGGGAGFLARRHGLTIDHLLAADVVTADGNLLRVDLETHPELFWAIRGGGGNFGVATRFKFRLHEVGTVVGGMLILPATPEVVSGFLAAADEAPDELSTIANVMPAPPLPFLPPDQHGRLVVMAQLAYAGDAEDGARAIAPLRALATPIVDMVRPISYPELFPPLDEDYRPTAAARTLFLDHVDHAAAKTIVDRIEASPATAAVTQLRVLGGAVARVPSHATAYAHRDRRVMANVVAMYTNPGDRPASEAWVGDLSSELTQDESGYVGFLLDEGEHRVRMAYPGSTWDRLREVKRQYDPDNFFRLNQNIPPAG